MLIKTRKPEIELGKKIFDIYPNIPAIDPIVNPTIGERKKYFEMASIDSIPTGIIVKKPNKPFNPLISN